MTMDRSVSNGGRVRNDNNDPDDELFGIQLNGCDALKLAETLISARFQRLFGKIPASDLKKARQTSGNGN